MVTINSVTDKQAKITETTAKMVVQLLSYAATYPEATIRYRAINMVIHIHNNTSFISEELSKIRAGLYHYLK